MKTYALVIQFEDTRSASQSCRLFTMLSGSRGLKPFAARYGAEVKASGSVAPCCARTSLCSNLSLPTLPDLTKSLLHCLSSQATCYKLSYSTIRTVDNTHT